MDCKDPSNSELTIYAKANYSIKEKWRAFAYLQGRLINYQTHGMSSSLFELDIDKDFSFFNPKAGISYQMSKADQLYFSYAKAHREQNRQDFEEGIEDAESLADRELWWR